MKVELDSSKESEAHIDPQKITEHLGGRLAQGPTTIYRNPNTDQIIGEELSWMIYLTSKDKSRTVHVYLIPGLKRIDIRLKSNSISDKIETNFFLASMDERPLLSSLSMSGVNEVCYIVRTSTQNGMELKRSYAVSFTCQTGDLCSETFISNDAVVGNFTYQEDGDKYPFDSLSSVSFTQR